MSVRVTAFPPQEAGVAVRGAWLSNELFPSFTETPAFRRLYKCADAESGRALSISLWDSVEAGQQAVQGLAQPDRPLPRRATVETFEVLLTDGRKESR
jgi:hypothetical protein